MQTVAIVGVGLIGGSFALALRQAGFSGRILGVSSARTLEKALRLGVIDEAAPLESAASQADLIYLAQPICRILEDLPAVDAAAKPGSLITDAGSTKRSIVDRARQTVRRAVFLGGHPMAGKESRGVSEAEAGLFVGRTYFLTPEDPAALEQEPGKEFFGWVCRIGAVPRVASPEEHDRLVALVSHLPQMASTALAAALAGYPEHGKLERAAGPGLRDATRLALSPWDVWADIVATNQAEIGPALDAYILKLKEIRTRLESAELSADFDCARDFALRLRRMPEPES